MRCFAVGARWSFLESKIYKNTKSSWNILNNYDLFFVSSGTPIAAYPLVILGKPFILWVATPFWEDRVHRIKTGSLKEKLLSWMSRTGLEKMEKEILEKASVILPMSNYAKSKFLEILGKDKDMIVCGYPISTNKKFIEKDYSKKIVVATGRFTDPRKNINMLFKAWSLIYQNHPDAILIIIGQIDESKKEMVRQSYSMFLAENITNNQKNSIYESASLMLISSWQEGLGIVGLEALCNKVPIVSTSCGGVLDFCIPNLTGEVTSINDHEAMAKQASDLLNDPAKLKTMGLAGLKLINENYSLEKIEKIWEEAIKIVNSQVTNYNTNFNLGSTPKENNFFNNHDKH
jgi:glycosyltransferase involved in cell wall biosynthesis